MLDITKQFSKSLQANISTAILLPDNYNSVNTVYNAYYILSETNPFIGSNQFQELVNKKNIALIAIFPSLNIKKNILLFESFKSQYDFSYLYQESIINQVIPTLERIYRLNNNYMNKSVIGLNNMALIAYTIAHDFTSSFGHVYSINLDITPFKAQFLAYMKSKFNPNIGIHISFTDDTYNYASNIYKMFGITELAENNSSNILDLIQKL